MINEILVSKFSSIIKFLFKSFDNTLITETRFTLSKLKAISALILLLKTKIKRKKQKI
tara:strand:+ start:46 stop:219 length:174 start_codon:yes stop_codon:yes gene_type:complete